MMNWIRLGAIAAAACIVGAMPNVAAAQGTTSVIKLTADQTSPTEARVGAYYTQVLLRTNGFSIPSDDNGKRQLGKAILTAFGLGEKVRSLTISAVLSQGGQKLPEIPLVTYTFDGKRKLTNFEVINSYLSPRWQLGAGDAVSVALMYKYSEQQTLSPTSITDNLKQLIPSDAIVSTLGTPFVQGVASLTASIFEIAGTRSVTARAQDDLLPYPGAVGARSLDYALSLPDGTSLGSIRAALVVSPSLVRPAILTSATKVADDLVRKPGEDVGSLSLDVAGAKKNLLQEAQGLSEYAAMAKAPTTATVRQYCLKANQTLLAYGTTALDRTTLVYQSLLDAGFDPEKHHPTANTWRTDCFGAADQVTLRTAINLVFTTIPPPKVDPVPAADRWPKSVKSAMGCWVTGKAGEWCARNAPDARAVLDKAIADKVQIGLFELPGVDLTTLPAGRMWDKYSLINALSSKADEFSCFDAGLILVRDDVSYLIGVEMKNDLVSTVQIQRATEDAARCVRS